MEITRKLASARKIIDITPIPGADTIECAQVDGWKVVVKKGEFQVGQIAAYYEIDSWLPENVAPFLCKVKREFNGVPGARLRTIRLRGQISQGLLLPLDGSHEEGDDLTELFGIQKYEAPIPAQLAGQIRGNFPSFIPKTDQERIQNLRDELADWTDRNTTWEVTEKLDGSSMTVYLYKDEFGVCSRNLDLKDSDTNSFWCAAKANNFEEKLRLIGRNLALQGELIGNGIQNNPYGLNGHEFYLFDIYDIDAGRYMNFEERHAIFPDISINHCPIIGVLKLDTCEELLAFAEGKSMLNASTEREGIVFKCLQFECSFKAISNKFLLAEK